MKATIFDIQRNSYVDGPGIRTTVFLKDVIYNVNGVTILKAKTFKKKYYFIKTSVPNVEDAKI